MPSQVTSRSGGADSGVAEARIVSVGLMGLAGLLAFVGTRSPVLAIAAVAVAGYVAVLATIGSERTAVVTWMAAFATAPMYKGIASSPGATVTPTDVLLLLGVLLVLPGLLARRLTLPSTYLVGTILVLVAGLFASAISDAPLVSLRDVVQLTFVMVGLPVVFAWWRPSIRVVMLLLGSYVAGHVVSVGWGLATGPIAGGNRYDGLAHHPNAFGEAGLMAFAALLYLFAKCRTVVQQSVVLGAMAISGVSVMLSGSRAATVVFAVLVLMVPVVERSAVGGFVLAMVGALGLVLLPYVLDISGEGSALTRLAGGGDASLADTARNDAISVGIDRFVAHPFTGDGFRDVELIHNVFLAMAVATGALGVIGFVLVLFALARPLFSAAPDRRLAFAVWAFIGIGAAAPGLQDRTLWVPMVPAVIAALQLAQLREGGGRGGGAQEVSGDGSLESGSGRPVVV